MNLYISQVNTLYENVVYYVLVLFNLICIKLIINKMKGGFYNGKNKY